MKRILAAILAATLLASFAGCNSGASGGAAPSAAPGGQTSSGAQAAEGVSAKGEFPIVKDKITLSVFAMKPAQVVDMSTNLFTEEMEKLTNIHIEWQTTTTDGLNEKRSLLFASNNYPDIMLSAGITAEEQMLYGTQGVLLPLNDLIDQNCVELPRLMNEIDWLRPAITTPDGNIYALPQINECYHCTLSQKLWINASWLKKLNLTMPTTTDEFEQVLLAFKNNDPNGNGKTDEIPLSGAITGWQTGVGEFLLNAFTYNDGASDGYRVAMNNGKVEFTPTKPEFQKGLQYLNKLYAQGLIDAAAFTQPSAQLKQLGENEGVEILGAATAGAISNFTKTGGDHSMSYEVLPPLKGPDGVQTTYWNPYGYVGGAFAITSANKYPVESIKWIDYIYSEAGTRRGNDGREGIEWETPAEGVKGINGEQAKWKRLVTFQEPQNFTWLGMDLGAVTSNYRLSEQAGDPATVEGFESRMYNETLKYEPFKPSSVLPPVYISTDNIDEMAQIKQPLLDFVKQSMAKFITGEMDPVKDWDAYVQNLKNLQYERYIEILQSAYDASAFKE